MRQQIANRIQQKHEKWQGVKQVDVDATTNILRGMAPDHQLRVPLVRLLTNAHATEDRVRKSGIGIAEHCRHCLHKHSSIERILWECPRLQLFRTNWPTSMKERQGWPSCAVHALICTAELDIETREAWPSIPLHAAQFLFAWMSLQRDNSICRPFAENYCPEQPMPPVQPASHIPNFQHLVVLHEADTIDIEWRRPMQISQLTAWSGTPQKFNLLFSFWTKWIREEHPQAVLVTLWMQAFTIF